MMYVTGTFKHNMDAKQRVTLPADFRRQIDGTLYLVTIMDCVYCFTPEGHQAYIEDLFKSEGGYDPSIRRHVALRRLINAQTVMVDVDSAGRLSLSKMPASTLEMLGREVAIVGNTDHFEIWNAKTFDEQQAALTNDDFASLMFRG